MKLGNLGRRSKKAKIEEPETKNEKLIKEANDFMDNLVENAVKDMQKESLPEIEEESKVEEIENEMPKMVKKVENLEDFLF